MQYILGIFTLLYRVPVALGVAHQAVAMLFWVMWLIFFHKLKPAVGTGADSK
jgi:cytochrome c oxidase assembly protein subunit 15